MNNSKNFDLLYLIAIFFLASGILAGLFFYNKGSQKNLNIEIPLTDNVTLYLNKVAVRPHDEGHNYIIFYAESRNSLNQPVDLIPPEPANPCYDYKKYPDYRACQKTPEYQKYLNDLNNYDQSINNPPSLILMTPEKQKCEIMNSYNINKKYPNLSYSLFSDYKANENKVGSIVFYCPKSSGQQYQLNYSGVYVNQAVNKEIQI